MLIAKQDDKEFFRDTCSREYPTFERARDDVHHIKKLHKLRKSIYDKLNITEEFLIIDFNKPTQD